MDVEEHFVDFSVSSDWEKFTASIEQVLSEWQAKPVESENIRNNWIVIHEKISFSESPYKFSYYKKLSSALDDNPLTKSQDAKSLTTSMISSSSSVDSSVPGYIQSAIYADNSEFPPKSSPHPIVEYFCLQEFAVITSAALDPVEDEAMLKIILSSCCIALNTTNSGFPIFVQFHHWAQQYFQGIAESCGIRTTFQMVHLKHVSDNYKYLSGLLDVFKPKLGPSQAVSIGVSAHFFYTMKAWHSDFTLETESLDIVQYLREQTSIQANEKEGSDKSSSESNDWRIFHAFTKFLPFGGLDDPFRSLKFVAGWPTLTEDIVVDSSAYSDLEPNNAPDWFFGLNVDDKIEFRLQEMLEAFCKLKNEGRTVEEILGKKLEAEQNDVQYMSALDRIAHKSPLPVASFNRVIKNVNRAQRQLLFSPNQYADLPPLSKEDLDTIISFLFPDASPDHQYPYPATFDRTPEFEKEHIQPFLDALQGVKSAPMGGLVWRLAVMLAFVHANIGATGAVAHLWAEVVLELRYRLENSIRVSGLELSPPNSGTCLLNQKLQMLNCCIERKLLREKKEKTALEEDSPVEESEDEDDEFFDCEDTMTTTEGEARLNKPVGRLKKCGRLRLIKTGEAMYIPHTQDPAPLTEDVLEEQAKMLVELGNDPEGTERRAKLMSESLTSDMQSFKAANPGATLEDFVRWYSPRDWIEGEEVDEFGNLIGVLSPRMKVPGNLWLEVWTNAHSIPARRQKRLFDDTKEAEKVLHWMGSRSISEISQLVLPCLLHATMLKILDESDNLPVDYKIPLNLPQSISQWTRVIGQSAEDNSNNNSSNDVWNSYRSSVLASISRCEKEISQIVSFRQKFPGLDLDEILKENQVEKERGNSNGRLLPDFIRIEEGPKSTLGQLIKLIFRKEQEISQLVEHDVDTRFGEPVKKVFVLRYSPPSSNSDALPQRMSCCLKSDEFLLAGIYSGKTDLG